MAKLLNGLLGKVSGSLSGVTFIVTRKVNIIQKKCNRDTVIYTQAQLNQQLKFAEIARFVKFIYSIFLFYPFKAISNYINSFNSGIKINSSSFVANGIGSVINLIVSQGELTAPDLISATFSVDNRKITLVYSSVITNENELLDDYLELIAIDLIRNVYYSIPVHPLRGAGSVVISNSFGAFGSSESFIFGTWRNSLDAALISNSSYVKTSTPV